MVQLAHSSRLKVQRNLFTRKETPMMNHVVLDIIFESLDVFTLKECRSVCRPWRGFSILHLLKKCALNVDAENVEQIREMEIFMNSYPSRHVFRHINCEKITHNSYPNIRRLMGPHVISFVVSHWWDDSRDLSLQDYQDILRICPSLKEIVMPSTQKFRKAQYFLVPKLNCRRYSNKDYLPFNLNLRTIRVTGEIQPDIRFWRIVSYSPKLKNLHIDCQLVAEFWNVRNVQNQKERPYWTQRMENLAQIEVQSYANEGTTLAAASYFLKTRSNLKKIIYDNYELSDLEMQFCSEHVKHSLEYLHVTLFNKQYDPWPTPPQLNWMTSSLLTKLKHYKLYLDHFCTGPIFCRALVQSILAPNLESVELSMFENVKNNTDWGQTLFIQMFSQLNLNDVTREAMTSLKLPPNVEDTSFIRPLLEIYPNIRELTLDRPTRDVMAGILYYWWGLERLTLILDCGMDWNFILTGLKLVEDPQGSVLKFDGTSLINLQNLQSLDIKMVGNVCCGESYYLNDMLIYHGLIHLKRIQHIGINAHMFSQEAIMYLRHHVSIFCHMDFEA